ncbi:transcriptional regulator, TetR family [Agrilactobacillus composti DSM 18527 = JCM 14202]|nr:TetR/AcrR family transcriptional regulator [Agrilactobacillus composti]GAF40396.1 transcriptional regulator, TetR family [Agrilactobacillus composti DSM 18527 = JCM 14202]
MARKKTITRQNILDAAFELVLEQGFKNFTARKIARWMNCSTQPIYLEFTCMDELKNAVLQRVQEYLVTEFYGRTYCDDALINLSLAFVDLARENNHLYRAIFVEDHFGVQTMREFCYKLAIERLQSNPDAKRLSKDRQMDLVTGCWIIATGIASLVSSGYINIEQKQMVSLLKAQISDFIQHDRFNSQLAPGSMANISFGNSKMAQL